ncbi:MAG: sugar kinase [Anaerolineae bacterium]
MYDVTTAGESLIRLSVPAGDRLEQAQSLDVCAGGAEGNVAALLARLGHAVAYVTALPDQALGRIATEPLREAGVDLRGVIWRSHGRIGTYFVETGEPPRPTQVIYDRAHSCAAQIRAEDLPLDLLLDTRLLHLTGVAAALSDSCREAILWLGEQARARGVALSVDVNYRSRLWTPAQAADAMSRLIPGASILFCKAADARLLFGMNETPADLPRALAERFEVTSVIVTHGADGAYAWQDGQSPHQPAIPVRILDRIGAGDALAGGVLHGWLRGDLAYGLRAGTMCAALALTQYGDAVVTTAAEVDALLGAQGADVVR